MKERSDEFRPLWRGGVLYRGESFNADSLLLASFAARCGAETVCDLGCGCGILLLLLSRESATRSLTGVELRADAAERCRENLAANGLDGCSSVYCADLRTAPVTPGSFELVVSNPPYFRAEAGGISPQSDRDRMRRESATLPELCASAAKLLTPGGSFCLVHRCERMAEVFAALGKAGLEVKRLRFFSARSDAAPSVFLCEARRGGAGLRVEPPIFQFGADGRESAEYRRITQWED